MDRPRRTASQAPVQRRIAALAVAAAHAAAVALLLRPTLIQPASDADALIVIALPPPAPPPEAPPRRETIRTQTETPEEIPLWLQNRSAITLSEEGTLDGLGGSLKCSWANYDLLSAAERVACANALRSGIENAETLQAVLPMRGVWEAEIAARDAPFVPFQVPCPPGTPGGQMGLACRVTREAMIGWQLPP